MNIFKRSALNLFLAMTLVFGGSAAMVPSLLVLPAQAQTQSSPSAILNRLKQANGINPQIAQQIQILESSDLNAATNGEAIVFSQGLWNALQNDDQRAFVIAHELSHITLNHVPKTQVRRVGLSLLGSALGRVFGGTAQAGSQIFDIAEQIGIDLIDKRFSRGAELAADNAALDYMVRAGYNPQAALGVFNTLEANAQGTRLPEFLQSHPVSATRIQALSQKIAAYQNASSGASRTQGRSAVQEAPTTRQLAPAPSGQSGTILRQIR